MKQITSTANPHFKMWRMLLQARGIRRHRHAIVSGSRVVSDMLNDRPAIVTSCLTAASCGDVPLALPDTVEQFMLDDALFRELDIFGTGHPLLVVAVEESEPFDANAVHPPMTLVVPFQDPSNVGAVVRSAVAFGVTGIVLTKEAASPYHPRSIRASGGYVFTATFRSGPPLTDMPVPPMPVYGLTSGGTPIGDIEFASPCALVPGIEGPGLPSLPWITERVAIPMSPGVESLNAAVATSIALYVWSRKRTE